MDEWTSAKHRQAARTLNRAIATGEVTPLQLAAAWEKSPRAVYQRAENEATMKVFEPALLFDTTGNVELAAELVGFTKRGIVCVAPMHGVPELAELVNGALEIGKYVGALQGAIEEGSSPASPGGRRFVGPESARVLELLTDVKRVAQALEQKVRALGELVTVPATGAEG